MSEKVRERYELPGTKNGFAAILNHLYKKLIYLVYLLFNNAYVTRYDKQ